MELTERYTLVLAKANQIEAELKGLNRWQENPLPREKFENMGAFGCNTMTFQDWLQFVLLERIHSIIENQDEFPSASSVGVYAVREFDGDWDASALAQLLCELDDLINSNNSISPEDYPDRPVLGSINLPLPAVVYQLAEVLPSFEGEQLEAQLQTFDMFLANADAEGRKGIVQLLVSASDKTTSSKERLRIRKAAMDVEKGNNAAARYNHEEAMKKYREEFKKNYPNKEEEK